MSTPKYQLHGSLPSSSDANIFTVTMTASGNNGNCTSDKTFAEVIAAHKAGRQVRCMYGGYILPLCSVDDTSVVYGAAAGIISMFVLHTSANTATYYNLNLPQKGVEFINATIADDSKVTFEVSLLEIDKMIFERTAEPIIVADSNFYRYAGPHTIGVDSYRKFTCVTTQNTVDAILYDSNDPATAHHIRETADHQCYFDITSDGEVSLKPSYRGTGASTYPASVGNGSSLELPKPLIIPDVINNIEVATLAPGMFYDNERVVEIILPPTVTAIPEYFCRDATNLRVVDGTERITSIGKAAFGATRIKKALFPSLTTLGAGAFVGCAYLEIADIGKVTTIPKQTFANCAFLREVVGGEDVISIDTLAFYYTRHLRDLPLLAHVTSVADYAFFYSRVCTSLPKSDTISSKAFPTSDNSTDFWSGVKFTPCRNRVVTKLSQLNPAWKDEYPLVDTTAITYRNACSIFTAMHIHSAITGKYYSDPREFVDELKSDTELEKFLYHDKWPGEFTNTSDFFEALGYRTSAHGSGDGNDLTVDDYKALTTALAQGAYVYTQAALQTNWANDYFDGGHAVMLYGINDLGEVCVLDSSILHEGYRETGFEPDFDVYTYTMPYQNIVGPSSNFVIVYPPSVNPDAGADLSGYVKAPATAAAGQVLAVKSVDSSGKPSDWVAVRLSNLGEFDALKKSVSAIDDTIGAGTPFVASAAVGQTVVVKSVDENGKPTEWKVADMASGGGRCHPFVDDWGDPVAEIVTSEEVQQIRIAFPTDDYRECLVQFIPAVSSTATDRFMSGHAYIGSAFGGGEGTEFNTAHTNGQIFPSLWYAGVSPEGRKQSNALDYVRLTHSLVGNQIKTTPFAYYSPYLGDVGFIVPSGHYFGIGTKVTVWGRK